MAFTLSDEQYIEELHCSVKHYRHKGTACEVLHIANDDPENLFSFCFRTIPRNSRGVAHILEHTVLCGSRRYPLKDPFVQLAKGSMNTFLNAMTYPDRTLYPASSAVHADLLNIMKVYGDAVYFPLLKKEMFQQEGHHLRLADKQLSIHGVVYNEMKGNYSNHDDIAMRSCMRSLFTSDPYTHDTGGTPTDIPDLTYEEFSLFHKTFYHPSNTLVFLYGNMETERYLDLLEREFLSSFSLQTDPQYQELSRISEPDMTTRNKLDVPYPSSGAGNSGQSSVSLNWRLFPTTDTYHCLVLAVLNELLIGNASAPLYKDLIESRLGESLTQISGYEYDLYYALFSVGLEGTRADRKNLIEEQIVKTLTRVHSQGFTEKNIEAVLRKCELQVREQKRGHNAALSLLNKAARIWSYQSDMFSSLKTNQALLRLKSELQKDSRYLQNFLKPWFLDNTNSSRITVYPDTSLQEQQTKDLEISLQKKLSAMNAAEQEHVMQEAGALLTLQQSPDKEEDLRKIPYLTRSDVPVDVERIQWEMRNIHNIPVIYTPQFTNDVIYLQCAFDIGHFSADSQVLMPLFGSAFHECGLENMSPEQLATEISFTTGGIHFGISADPCIRNDNKKNYLRPMIFIQIKVLKHLFADACTLLSRVFREANLKNITRVSDCLLERRNGIISSLIPEGHAFLLMRGGMGISSLACMEDRWHGIEQLQYLLRAEPEKLTDSLMDIRNTAFTANALNLSLTCPEEDLARCESSLEQLIASLPKGTPAGCRAAGGIEMFPAEKKGNEVLLAPASIAHICFALPASPFASLPAAAEAVLAHLLTTDYLWQKVRMEGGAYGGFAVCRPKEGLFSLLSYRDPHVERTISIFYQALEDYAKKSIDTHSLDLALFSIIGNELRSLSPASRGDKNLYRSLHNITDDLRQQIRNNLLALSPKDIRSAAQRLADISGSAGIAVMTNKEMLQTAAETYPDIGAHTTVLPI